MLAGEVFSVATKRHSKGTFMASHASRAHLLVTNTKADFKGSQSLGCELRDLWAESLSGNVSPSSCHSAVMGSSLSSGFL